MFLTTSVFGDLNSTFTTIPVTSDRSIVANAGLGRFESYIEGTNYLRLRVSLLFWSQMEPHPAIIVNFVPCPPVARGHSYEF